MSELIYIDSNVYLDYLLNRKDKLRPLGDFAFELFRRAINCEFYILISEFLLEEIENHAEKDKIERLLTSIKEKTIMVNSEKTDITEAKKISLTNRWDALHYILAKRGNADLIITRNIQHFSSQKESLIPLRPENLWFSWVSDLQTVFPENI